MPAIRTAQLMLRLLGESPPRLLPGLCPWTPLVHRPPYFTPLIWNPEYSPVQLHVFFTNVELHLKCHTSSVRVLPARKWKSRRIKRWRWPATAAARRWQRWTDVGAVRRRRTKMNTIWRRRSLVQLYPEVTTTTLSAVNRCRRQWWPTTEADRSSRNSAECRRRHHSDVYTDVWSYSTTTFNSDVFAAYLRDHRHRSSVLWGRQDIFARKYLGMKD